MLTLTRTHVRLRMSAKDKVDAIRIVGQVMVEEGFIEPGYIDSMVKREHTAATYLGSGIAIPHGQPDARELVRTTGVVVVQFPDGVEWIRDGHARVVVGIAARSDEHLEVLASLTGVLGDVSKAEALACTTDLDYVVATLNGEATAPGAGVLSDAQPATASHAGSQSDAQPTPPSDAGILDDTQPASMSTLSDSSGQGSRWAGKTPSIEVAAPAPHGLHARPSTVLVEVARRFRAEISIHFEGRTANAKSIITLLSLGAPAGSPLVIEAFGPDAEEALAALRAAFDAGLDEAPAASPTGSALQDAALPIPRIDYEGRLIAGLSASPGIASGPVWTFQHERLEVAETARDPEREHRRLEQALAGTTADLRSLHDAFLKKAGAERAAIFKAHLELLDDPELEVESHRLIDTGRSAGSAWREVFQRQAAALAQLEDPVLAARAADLGDVGRRVLRLLAEVVEGAASLPDHPVVLIAEDLSPSDTAKLDPSLVLGLCTAGGGATSHTAIIARSLDIPSVVGAGPTLLDLQNGQECIVDGDAGVLVVGPSANDLERAAAQRERLRARREAERLGRYEPAITRDGRRVDVAANITSVAQAEAAVEAGGEGVGLMRTEFLFLERNEPPGEEEQYQAYRAMVRALNGLPITLRTLDIGGDKRVPYLSLPAEDNPFLGLRGIRLCFEREDLFRTQLRAMLRASLEGPVRIMFPMIATPEELAKAKAITEAVRSEVGVGPVEIGIMIEVPSAVMMAPQLAKQVSFFSIGANDLTQYVLAMDRLHPTLAPRADGLHPSILRMIDLTVQAARAEGIRVGTCGGIAGDPAGAVILAGMGVTELSMAVPSIPAIKALLRTIDMAEAERLAQQALACGTAAEVRAAAERLLAGPPR